MTPRRDEIEAAVAAYDRANPFAQLPRNTVRLLTAMFPAGEVCRLTLDAIAAFGFSRRHLPHHAEPPRPVGLPDMGDRHQRGAFLFPPAPATAEVAMRLGHREKVLGPGRAVPLDRIAKARVIVYARAWCRQHARPGQRSAALGRAALFPLSPAW
jgi:hypothetical protein